MTFPTMENCRDRDLECEASLEAEFDALIARASEAGWTADEVANALLSLAQARIESMRGEAVVGTLGIADRLAH